MCEMRPCNMIPRQSMYRAVVAMAGRLAGPGYNPVYSRCTNGNGTGEAATVLNIAQHVKMRRAVPKWTVHIIVIVTADPSWASFAIRNDVGSLPLNSHPANSSSKFRGVPGDGIRARPRASRSATRNAQPALSPLAVSIDACMHGGAPAP